MKSSFTFKRRGHDHDGGRGATIAALPRSTSTKMMLLLLTTLIVTSSLQGCVDARTRRLAMLRRKSVPPSDASSASSSLHGFPFMNENNLPQLESSIFLYRGGSNSDHEDELDLANNDSNNVIDNENDNQEVVDNNADNIDHKVEHEDNIQVTSTVANSPESSPEAEATVETSTHNVAQRKKSNAVGDPDGNSSDDESSDMDEDELEELNELERELMMLDLERQKKQGEGDMIEGEGGFETLVELAGRREGMKRRIAEMEQELSRRRNENAEEGETDMEIDLDDEEGLEDELDDDIEEGEDDDSTTSYHLTGTNVTKEDDILKRQRKYKRGSIFKGGSSKKRRSFNASSSVSNSTPQPSKPQIPTTISTQTLDNMLISAFQSMIFLPPPSPRLPSEEGSTSLRNVDVASRRRLDRRTLYHGLLAELGGSHHHAQKDGALTTKDDGSKDGFSSIATSKKDNSIDSMIRRRYLDTETSRSLKGALSLACQPKWREKLMVSATAAASPLKGNAKKNKDTDEDFEDYENDEALPTWWHRGGVCLFPASDDENVVMFEEGMSPMEQRRRPFQRQQSFMGGQPGMGQGMGGMGSGMDGGMGGDGQGGPPQGFFGPDMQQEDESSGATSQAKPWRCTMGMQETVAMALAHSLSCGLALIDDDALIGVRTSVERSLAELAVEMAAKKTEDGDEGEDAGDVVLPTINPEELRNSALLGHLVRLANEGKLLAKKSKEVEDQEDLESDDQADDQDDVGKESSIEFGTISHRMTRDMELGLDDPNDDLAVESLRLMKEDEKHWFEPIDEMEEESYNSPTSLVLFLRCDTSSSILRSKSAVETLAQECVKNDAIHMLMLGGKGIDASTTSLPGSASQAAVGAANGRMMNQQQPSMMQQQQQQGKAPFSFMSQFPPGSPEFNAQMSQANKQMQGHNGQFHGPPGGAFSGANNPNASGMHDPEGSRRFNIFLARTVDPTGRPQIMGTIASPQAGNLFPQILANMAKENLRKIREQGVDEDNEEQVMFIKQMEELANSATQMSQQQQQPQGGDGSAAVEGTPNTALFNATITSPFGSEIFSRMMNQDGENGGSPGEFQSPPENVRRAIQEAMWGVIDRLAQMSPSAASNSNSEGKPQQQPEGTSVPMNIARTFSQVLSNENLRRGIAENLSRAAPALINPHCQGVMLSVYVPPGSDHPNKGMMPGDQYKQPQQQQPRKQQTANQQMKAQQQRQEQQTQDQQPAVEKGDVPHGMGGWLNKILSSSDKGKQHNEVEETDSAAIAETEDSVAESSSSDTTKKVDEVEEKPVEKDSSSEQQDTPKPSKRSSSKGKKSKREKLDRARTLAVAAAALAGANKNRKDRSNQSGGGNRPLNIKLTPEQKAERNLIRLQALCRHIPLPSPIDPVRLRSWDAWADREEGSVIFRTNKRTLTSHLDGRNLSIDAKSGTKGAGIVLRQMMSVRDIGEEEMEDVIRCAVEIEAGKSQRHHESPWGVVKPTTAVAKPSLATDKSLLNFLHDDATAGENSPTTTTQYIHPNSFESALSLICGVSPSPGSQGSSSSSSGGTGVMASHRTKEDLMALAQDKHERALIPNCVSPQDIGVTYDMIGGLFEVKELLRQSITYPLKFPHLYSEGIAREAVKGVLLFGPPGTGKTMLAKAVATEGGASFLSVDASSVENKWLGESEKNAKAVFTLARRLAPCVIFIDEVDSLLSSREGSSDDSAHGTLTSVKTTMMSEWDGLNSGTNGKGDAGSDRVVVVGSTNRPFDLDEAVLRRFPRRILVDLPDLETRREILEVTLAENRLGADVNLTMIAERLEGYTGSDLKEVCREAVVQISHEHARMLDRGELLDDEDEEYLETAGSGFQMLRPVTMKDFESAMRKLKRSVSETGRELAKVWEWNDEYGEIKKTSKRDVLPQMMNMFL